MTHGNVNDEMFFTLLITKESYFEDKMNNIHETLESIIVGNNTAHSWCSRFIRYKPDCSTSNNLYKIVTRIYTAKFSCRPSFTCVCLFQLFVGY